MSVTISQNVCVLYQNDTDEALVCRLAIPVAQRREEACAEICNLAAQLQEVDASPNPGVGLIIPVPRLDAGKSDTLA